LLHRKNIERTQEAAQSRTSIPLLVPPVYSVPLARTEPGWLSHPRPKGGRATISEPLRRRGVGGASAAASDARYGNPPSSGGSGTGSLGFYAADSINSARKNQQEQHPNSGNNGAMPSGPLSGGRSSAVGPTPTAEFDALRREATKLERHLEDRVARYQQLAQRLTTGADPDHFGHSNQRSSLLESAETGTLSKGGRGSGMVIEEEESALAADISRSISSMSDLIERRMAPAAERTGRSQHSLLVKRYREILFDCSADFKKTSAAVARRREAMELFRGSDMNGNVEEGPDPATEHLLRERNAILNSTRAAESVLGQAEEIRTDLRSQGTTLRGVRGTMTSIAGNVPGLNGLIDSIRRRRNRDDQIVSAVIAACILYTLWYLFA